MASGKSLMQLSKCALSTQATGQATKMVRPPVSMFGIDGRYATALYSAASKKGKLQQVDQNLKMLLQLNEKDVRFREFLMNPLIKVSLIFFLIDHFNVLICFHHYSRLKKGKS